MSNRGRLGILVGGGPAPGLNGVIAAATIEGINQGYEVIGFRDGFKNLAAGDATQIKPLTIREVKDIHIKGGSILGTARTNPTKSEEQMQNVFSVLERLGVTALVTIGGDDTAFSASHVAKRSGGKIKVAHVPKTIDNDLDRTVTTFGFDTAVAFATECIDRLHSTAHSHHRIIVAEIMGHRAGWLTLGSGIAGGADVILIPEIPYDVERIAEAIRRRSRNGTNFSIVAVAEGAMSRDDARSIAAAEKRLERARTLHDKKEAKLELTSLDVRHQGNTMRLAKQLEELTHLESRVTILGYVQRGGTPSAADRILATRLGTACTDLINEEHYGVMVAARGDGTEPVPLEKVAGKRKIVPPDHSWVRAAREVGTCLGD